jgi:hypothetical protein
MEKAGLAPAFFFGRTKIKEIRGIFPILLTR